MKKILHVTRTIEPIGGCELYVLNLIKEQIASGFNVSLVTAQIPSVNLGIELSIISIPEIASLRHEEAEKGADLLNQSLKTIHPDIIHIHDLNNPFVIEQCSKMFPTVKTTLNADAYCGGIDKYLYTSKKPCKFSLGNHCLAIAYYERCMPRHPKRSLEIITLKRKSLNAQRFIKRSIVPSKSSKQILIQNGVPEHQISVIPLFTSFHQASESNANIETTHNEVLFVGRLRPYKGAEHLLRAMKFVNAPYTLTIVGDGEERGKLERLAHELRIDSQTQFIGGIPHSKVSTFFKRCSVVAVPSIYPDSFPTVGLEAMMHAKPVVAFDAGGIGEWLADQETGYLVPIQDTKQFGQKIDSLLTQKKTAALMGQRGLEIASEKFTSVAHLGLMNQLYEDVLCEPSK